MVSLLARGTPMSHPGASPGDMNLCPSPHGRLPPDQPQPPVAFMFLPTPILCIYLLAVPSLGCCAGFSLGVPSGGHSLVAVRGLLTAVASLVAEQTSKVVALGLSWPCRM